MPQATKLESLLGLLSERGVECVVVGGTAAVLQGAPVQTFDLDIVHRRSRENVERLLGALGEIHAHARVQPERKVAPRAEHLLGVGQVLLVTDLGPLDVLCTLEEGQGYEEILPDCVVMEVGDLRVQVLRLARLIQAKRASNRPKDRAVLPLLEATLEESEASGTKKVERDED